MTCTAHLIADHGRSAVDAEFFRSAPFLVAEGVTHTLFVENTAAIPVIVREIPGTNHIDAVSPYGYPGGTISEVVANNEIDFSRTGLVSLFVRDRIDVRTLGPGGTRRGTVLLHDPEGGRRVRGSLANTVRANARLGFRVEAIPGPLVDEARLDEFRAVYLQNMTRVGAAPKYFFSREYLRSCLRFERSWLIAVTSPTGSLAAGVVCAISDGLMHYFLGATELEYQRYSPIKNGLLHLLDMCDDMSVRCNLGGGFAPGDGLEQFKRGFANAEADFVTYEIVCNERVFRGLAPRARRGEFFPPYRSSADVKVPAARPTRTATARRSAPSAVVMGGSCIEIVRPLGMAGVDCTVITAPDEGSQWSRHVRSSPFDWRWSPTSIEDPRLLERVVDVARAMDRPPVLFYCCEPSLQFVSRHRAVLQEWCDFVVPDADLVERLSDKARFSALADGLDLPVPATRLLGRDSARDAVASGELRFPLIVKPTLRDELWESSHRAKAVRVDSAEELRPLLDGIADDRTLVLQELIDGPESAIESYHVYIDATGEVVADFTGRKIRTYPLVFGHSTALTTTDDADLIDLGRSISRRLGLTGVAKLDFKRTEDGRLVLLEVNARFNLWHHLGARAGVNLPALVHSDLTGRPVQRIADPARIVATWVHPTDVRSARSSGMSLRSWASWAWKADAKAYWSRSDPLPLLGAGVGRAVRRARR